MLLESSEHGRLASAAEAHELSDANAEWDSAKYFYADGRSAGIYIVGSPSPSYGICESVRYSLSYC